jgi:hypothetical protein
MLEFFLNLLLVYPHIGMILIIVLAGVIGGLIFSK